MGKAAISKETPHLCNQQGLRLLEELGSLAKNTENADVLVAELFLLG